MDSTIRRPFYFTPSHLAVAAILLGCAMRLAMYLQNPSFWFDEISVALCAATRTRFDMQTAPPLYMWMETLFGVIGGINEYALRLPSLLAGMLTLLLVWRLGVRMGGPFVGAFAAAMAALSANLCRYSNELKPYIFDALFTAIMLFLAVPVLRDGGSPKQQVILFLTCLVAILFSTTSIFVIAGIQMAFLLSWLKRDRKWPHLMWFGAASVVCAASFALVYNTYYASSAASAYMRHYWAGAALDLSSGPQKTLATIAKGIAVPALGLDDLSILMILLVLALMTPGIIAAFRSDSSMGALLCVPPVMAILAAAMVKWYLIVRLMLFIVPAISVLMAMGAWEISRGLPRRFQLRSFTIICVLSLLVPAKYSLWNVRHPEREANRGVVTAALRRAMPDDVIYVYPRSTTAWTLYSTDWRSANRPEVLRILTAIERSGPNAGNVASRHAPVVHEGFDWRSVRDGRIELFGVPTGRQVTSEHQEGVPDPGWADNEVSRMMREGSARSFWVVATNFQESDMGSLLRSFKQHGFSVETAYSGAAAVLLRAVRS